MRFNLLTKYLDILCCPACKGTIVLENSALFCSTCRASYPIVDNIPHMYMPHTSSNNHDITNTIKDFYETTPFPNYDDCDDAAALIHKSHKSIFPRLLDKQIPFNSRILECGCGTGQLSNFLSIANRFVVGTDICHNSLKLADQFREKNNLQRALFIQANLFMPVFKPGTFDLVISTGVLHHTSSPYEGFRSITRLCKPGGYIILGLYHTYARIATDIRRHIFNLSHNKFLSLDTRLRDRSSSKIRTTTWFLDQYKNPHESKHTVSEVMNWFRMNEVTFVTSIPKMGFFDAFNPAESLFTQHPEGNAFGRFFKELSMSITDAKDGGFFIVIGKKQHSDATLLPRKEL